MVSLPDGSVGKNVIIFRVDMNSSVLIDNKKKDILIPGKGSTQELDEQQQLNIQLIFQS